MERRYGNVFQKLRLLALQYLNLELNDAVSHFNIGNMATIQISKHMNIMPCHYTTIGCTDNIASGHLPPPPPPDKYPRTSTPWTFTPREPIILLA